LTTQASTKVYCTKRDARVTRHTLAASVGQGGLLVLAPDPVVPYANAAYDQRQTFELAPGSSLIAVDWVGAGRVSRGERWAFTSFSSRNSVHRLDETSAALSAAHHGNPAGQAPDPPQSPAVVIDAVRLVGGPDGPANLGFDLSNKSFNAAVTVLCTGSVAAGVSRRLRLASAALAARRVGHRPGVLKQNSPQQNEDGRQENEAGLQGDGVGGGGPSGAYGGEAALVEATMRTLLGDAVLGVGISSDGGDVGGYKESGGAWQIRPWSPSLAKKAEVPGQFAPEGPPLRRV
jgi:hypothetical protein